MPRRKSKGRAVKRNRAAAAAAATANEADARSSAPHSFVIHRGAVGKSVADLAGDLRRVMEPYTASRVKVRPKNVVKDFLHVAGPLNVSHLCLFTRTDLGPYLKVGRFPRGPTLTFRVADYVLARDVRSSLRRQLTHDKQFDQHALLIMNQFVGDAREIKLTESMFQNLFPSINVTNVKLKTIRRCVLMNRDPRTGLIDFRHYAIKVVPVGISRGVKKIVQGKVPNLSRYDNMAEYLDRGGGGNASESEYEDDESNRVTLPQAVSARGNMPSHQSSVRLVELGPRMTLDLIKIEEGLVEGEVLYHKLVEKTEEEKKAIRVAREKRKREKEARKKEQAKNVRRKEDEKREHKNKSLKGMMKKEDLPEGFKSTPDEDEDMSEEDNDAKYYEDEVGEKPEKDMFDKQGGFRKRKKSQGKPMLAKRFKKSSEKKDGPNRRGGGEKGGKAGFKKPKRPRDVFNSQGVGPNYNKSKVNKGPRVTAKRGRKR